MIKCLFSSYSSLRSEPNAPESLKKRRYGLFTSFTQNSRCREGRTPVKESCGQDVRGNASGVDSSGLIDPYADFARVKDWRVTDSSE